MNLFELQERLKDFSKDQLVKEMQAPSGMAPQYLVLSELQRRGRMEQAFANEQNKQGPQSTVAEEAVAAAGVPQGGLAQMAQAMAPRTDVTQNTGAAPVQGMAEGGVVRMQPGGLAGVSADLESFMPTEMQATVNEFLDRNRLRGGFGDNVEYNYEAFLAEMGLSDTPDARDAFRRYQDRMNTQYALEGPQNDPSLFMPNIDRAPEGFSLADISPSLAPTMPGAESAPDIASRSPLLQPAAQPDTFALDAAATEDPATEEEYLLRNILANSEAAIARDTAAVPAFADRRAPDFVTAMPPASERAMLPQPNLFDDARAARTADYNPRTLAADAQLMGIDLPDRVDIPEAVGSRGTSGRDRQLEASRGRSARRDLEDLAASFEAQALQDDANFTAEEMFQRGLGTTDFGGNDPYSLPTDTAIRPVSVPGMDTGTPLSIPEGGIEDLLPPARPTPPSDGTDAGDAGGAGGGRGGRGGRSDMDRLLEQDKWLALAQFGLGLMSSQAPSFGQAVGESGIAALGQLSKARKEAMDRQLAEEELAIRRAAAAASNRRSTGLTPSNLISLRDSLQKELSSLTEFGDMNNAATVERATALRERLVAIDAALGFNPMGGNAETAVDMPSARTR